MNKKYGFTLVEIMIVVAIIGLLAAIAIPSFVTARANARASACVNNLRQVDSAKEQSAMANSWANDYDCSGAAALTLINAYIKGGAPSCPSSGTYTYSNIGTDPTCSVGAGHAL